MLGVLATVMFLTLLYYALMGRTVDIQNGVLVVAAYEPNTAILTAELILLPLIAIWAFVECIFVFLKALKRS